MSLTENGISTTRNINQFAAEVFFSRINNKFLVQWDYRDETGTLHSGIAPSPESALKAASQFGYHPAA